MQDLKWNDRLAVTVSRKHAMNCPTISKEMLYCFRYEENIHTITVAMLTPKGYFLLSDIDRILRYSMEGGLFNKWELDSTERIYSTKVKNNPNGFEYVPLQLEHSFGVFFLLAVGLGLSVIILIIELIIYHKAKQRKELGKRAGLWIYAEKFIDGQGEYT